MSKNSGAHNQTPTGIAGWCGGMCYHQLKHRVRSRRGERGAGVRGREGADGEQPPWRNRGKGRPAWRGFYHGAMGISQVSFRDDQMHESACMCTKLVTLVTKRPTTSRRGGSCCVVLHRPPLQIESFTVRAAHCTGISISVRLSYRHWRTLRHLACSPCA